MVLSEQEDAMLRQFCKLVDDILDCRFIRRAKEQGYSITVDRDPNKSQIPHYDRDDFRSFATLFRKLIANREPTQLFKVMKILKRFAPADRKDSFKEIKAKLNREAENPPLALAIGLPDAEVSYTPKRICDIFFNGMVFHTDPELQDDLTKILDFEPMVMAAFLRYTSVVVNVATQYSGVIEYHSFFKDEKSYSDT